MQLTSSQHASIKRERGFTLIEISIVIIVFGLLIGMFFPLYTLYKKNLAIEQTKESIDAISNAIGVFRGANGRYPCPAAFTLARNNPLYGREDPVQCAESDPSKAGKVALNTCDGTTGICVYPAGRTVTNKDGVAFTPRVVVGAIPFRQLNLDEKYQLDGYGRKFTYAVTEELGNTDTFIPANGGIEFIDKDGNSLLTNSSGGPRSAHFIVLSHGENGYGAYSSNGIQIACAGTTGFERQNCPDTTNGSSTFRIAETSKAQNNGSEYDDIVSAHLLEDITYFNYSDNPAFSEAVAMRVSGGATVGEGANETTKQYPLAVPGGVVRSRESLIAPRICEPDDTTCFSSDKIAGNDPDMKCDEGTSGKYVVKIANGKVHCTNTIEIRCRDTEMVTGVNADGSLKCGPAPDVPAVCEEKYVTPCRGQPDVRLEPTNIVNSIQVVSSGVSLKKTYQCKAGGTWSEIKTLETGVCECNASSNEVIKDTVACGTCSSKESYKLISKTTTCPSGVVTKTVLEDHCSCDAMIDSKGRSIAKNCRDTKSLSCPEGYRGTKKGNDISQITLTSFRLCTPTGSVNKLGPWQTETVNDCVCIENNPVFREVLCPTSSAKYRQTRTLNCQSGEWSTWTDYDNRNQICGICKSDTRERERACPTGYTGKIITIEEISSGTNCEWRYKQDKPGGNQCVRGEGVETKWIPGGTMTSSAYSVGKRANVATDCTPGDTGECWLSGFKNYNNCRCE